MKKFKVGKTYNMRSICDDECIWYCEIISRTAKFVTMKVSGYRDPIRAIVGELNLGEICSPLGHYSMSPLLRAENEVEVPA